MIGSTTGIQTHLVLSMEAKMLSELLIKEDCFHELPCFFLSHDSAAIPAATLEFAMMCLRNALLLLPEDPLDVGPPRTEEQTENR